MAYGHILKESELNVWPNQAYKTKKGLPSTRQSFAVPLGKMRKYMIESCRKEDLSDLRLRQLLAV